MRKLLTLCLLLTLAPSSLLAQDVVPATAQSPVVNHYELARIRQMVRSLGPRASTPAQLVQLVRELPREEAAVLFLQIGQEYLAQGHWDLGATVLMQLLERYPDESVATEATLELVRLYSSGEVVHSQRELRDTAAELRLPPGWHATEQPTGDPRRAAGTAAYALNLANDRLRRHPELAEHSALAFQCAAAARLSGNREQEKSWLSLVKHKRAAGAWRDRAQTEEWLAESRNSEPPLVVTHCTAANRPPHLDGVLDEPFWQSATERAVVGDDPARNHYSVILGPQAHIQLAYDAEHLYFAASCHKLPGADYTAAPGPRSYDADLTGHDQVRLWLDVDRDYASRYELVIDHRGWTGDRCWRNADWNPRWYVAAGADEGAWTAEAAIPWSELAVRPPQVGEAWAVAKERVADGADRGDEPAEFGLLLFE